MPRFKWKRVKTLSFINKKFIDIQKNIDLQGQSIYVEKNNSKKSLHILEDSASGVQVRDINK